MSDTEPAWDPDAHWQRVIRRGTAIKNRRRLALAACCVAALALLSAGVAAALTRGSGSGGQKVAALGRGSTTSTAAGVVPGSTSLPNLSTIPAVSVPVTPASTPPTSTTATSMPHTATTRHGAVTTVPATTTTTTPQPPACPLTDMSFATVTDQPSYVMGAAVSVALKVTNNSKQTCTGPSQSGLGATGTITEGSLVVATTHGPAIACTVQCLPPVIAPGASTTYDAGSWYPTAAGSYTAQASRVGRTGTPAHFTVTSG
ncbi:MAG TPA: hypothetical protein VHT30_11935 [Acidimicrobiales bacterium]|jgi:hypothetical protein|nr:hypothetical protein [Acidimicrobiales bacterium]